MKYLVALLTTALLTTAVASPADAKTRRSVTVDQPSMLSCVVMPFPGTACPLHERMIGSIGYGAAIGTGFGALAGAGVWTWHALQTGALIGGGVGAAGPFIIR